MADAARKPSDAPNSAEVRRGKHTRRPGEPVVENEPAASPLGTDDEAAGRPPEDNRVRGAVEGDPKTAEPHDRFDQAATRPTKYGMIALLALAAFLALVIAALMLG